MRLPERVAYGPGGSQFCELFVPTTTSPGRAGPYPVVVLVHGGFWRAQYDRTLQWRVAGDLCERDEFTVQRLTDAQALVVDGETLHVIG